MKYERRDEPMKRTFELCKGRHATPATEAIFPTEVDPTDFSGLNRIVAERIPSDTTELVVYVTGLTPAMLAVVHYCWQAGITLTAMHYDRATGEYYPQTVLWFQTCQRCGERLPITMGRCPNCGG